MDKPVHALRAIARKSVREYASTMEACADLEAQLAQKPTFIDKILGRPKSRAHKLEKLTETAEKIKGSMYLELLRLVGKEKNNLLYVKHDSVLLMSSERCYAFPTGSNGVNALPILLVMPENRREFEPATLMGML